MGTLIITNHRWTLLQVNNNWFPFVLQTYCIPPQPSHSYNWRRVRPWQDNPICPVLESNLLVGQIDVRNLHCSTLGSHQDTHWLLLHHPQLWGIHLASVAQSALYQQGQLVQRCIRMCCKLSYIPNVLVTTTIAWLDWDCTYSHLTNYYVYFDWEELGKWRWHQYLLTVICRICIRNATWSPVKRWDTQLSVLWQHSRKCCLLSVSRQNTILVMVHPPDVLRLQGSNHNT